MHDHEQDPEDQEEDDQEAIKRKHRLLLFRSEELKTVFTDDIPDAKGTIQLIILRRTITLREVMQRRRTISCVSPF